MKHKHNKEEIARLKFQLTAMEQLLTEHEKKATKQVSEAGEQARRLLLLNEMGTELNMAVSIDEIFKITAFSVNMVVGGDKANIALLNQGGDNFELFELDGMQGATSVEAHLPVEDTMLGYAIQQKRTLVVPDLQATNWVDAHRLAGQGLRSAIIAPLMTPRQIIGVLNIASKQPNAYLAGEESLMLQIASRLTTAIENRRLLDQSQAAIRREHILREATAKIRNSIDMDSVISNAVQEIGRALERPSFVYLDNHKKEVGIYHYHIDEETTLCYLFDHNEIQSIKAKDFEGISSISKLLNKSNNSNNQLVTFPVVVYGQVIGKLGLYDNPDHPLSSEELDFLAIVSEQVAEALERARLLEQTQRRAMELETVAQVSAIASTTLDVKKLLQTVVDLTKSSFSLYHVHIYLLNEAGDTVELAAGAGKIGKRMVEQGWTIPLDKEDSLVAKSARTRSNVIINDVRNEPGFMPNPFLPDVRAELAVPLITGERVLGVLDAQSDIVGRFTDNDARIQNTLATQIAVSLQNANLYLETQKRATQLEKLSKIETTLSLVLNEEEIVTAVSSAVSGEGIRVSMQYFDIDEEGQPITLTPVAIIDNGVINREAHTLGKKFEFGSFPISKLLLTSPNDVILIHHIQTDPHTGEELRQLMTSLGFHTMAIIPLHSRGQWQGMITFMWPEIHRFTENERFMFDRLLESVGAVVASHRFYNATETARTEARTALEAVKAIQRRYTVQVWEEYRDRHTTINYEKVCGDIPPLGNQLSDEIKQIISQKRIAVIKSNGREKSAEETQSSLIVPLTIRDEIIGVLGLQNMSERNWLPEEIALVEAVSEQIVQAAENLRLIDETQQRAAREQHIGEIGEKIRATQSLDEALKVAVKEVGLSLKAVQTTVKLEVN